MDPIPPPPPTTILIDDNTPPWYLQTVLRQAQTEIPDHFPELPAARYIRFEQHAVQVSSTRGKGSGPKDVLPTMLAVGEYDGPLTTVKLPVYAFIYGDKKNQIGYCYKADALAVVRLEPSALGDIAFEEPFCDLGDNKTSSQGIRGMIRALALYYFLAAGHIAEITHYSTFWNEFKRASGWIANKGSRPKPHPKREGSNVVDQFATDAKVVPTLDKQATGSLGRRLNIPTSASPPRHGVADVPAFPLIKREREQDVHIQEPTPKRHEPTHMVRARADVSRSSSPELPLKLQIENTRLRASESQKDAQHGLQSDPPATENTLLRIQIEQLTTDKAKLQTQITHLTADYGALQQECDYVRNAYDGLKQKHDQLTTERANELDREHELQHKLEVSNETVLMERARKERAVQQAAVVEAEFTQYRTRMEELFSQAQSLHSAYNHEDA